MTLRLRQECVSVTAVVPLINTHTHLTLQSSQCQRVDSHCSSQTHFHCVIWAHMMCMTKISSRSAAALELDTQVGQATVCAASSGKTMPWELTLWCNQIFSANIDFGVFNDKAVNTCHKYMHMGRIDAWYEYFSLYEWYYLHENALVSLQLTKNNKFLKVLSIQKL